MTLQDQITQYCAITGATHGHTQPNRVTLHMPDGTLTMLHGWAVRDFLRKNNRIIETAQRQLDEKEAAKQRQAEPTPLTRINKQQALQVNTAQQARAAFAALFTGGQ